MNVVYAFVYLFLGQTHDGVDHWGAYSIGPDNMEHCSRIIAAVVADPELNDAMRAPGSVSGCLHEKSLHEFIIGKGCKEESKHALPDGAIERSYSCDSRKS